MKNFLSVTKVSVIIIIIVIIMKNHKLRTKIPLSVCDISATVRYIGHTMSAGACRWHAPSIPIVAIRYDSMLEINGSK